LNPARLHKLGPGLRSLSNPASFAVGVSCEDKFGPMGMIRVCSGTAIRLPIRRSDMGDRLPRELPHEVIVTEERKLVDVVHDP
jgi:hypothetical protein